MNSTQFMNSTPKTSKASSKKTNPSPQKNKNQAKKSNQVDKSNKDFKISPQMKISEILLLVPEAVEFLLDYGLYCTSCSISAWESLEDGCRAHNLDDRTIEEIVEGLNYLYQEKKRPHHAGPDEIYLSPQAAEKIKEFAAAENKSAWGLKITAELNSSEAVEASNGTSNEASNGDPNNNLNEEPVFRMEFQKEAQADDLKFEFHGVKIFIPKKSLPYLLGRDIDYLETPYGSGFKFFKKPH